MPTSLPSSVFDCLPSLQVTHSLKLADGDLLVHAPGFEDRTMASSEIVNAVGRPRAILLDYRPLSPQNRLGDVRELLRSRSVAVNDDDLVVYDRFDPGDFQARLQARLTVRAVRRVVVDISTMSKLAIMLVLQACREMDADVQLFYAEALSYRPSKDEFEQARAKNEIHRPTIQVFTGVHGVVRAASLASVAMQGQPTAALVFMSFNDALTQVLLNTVFPSRLFLINGRPPVHSWREAATAWIHDQVRREWEEDNPLSSLGDSEIPLPTRAASTLDYRESVSLLLQLYWQLSATHRILLAPAGSKMQAVGAYLTKALHPDIHVEYPSPDGFLPEYSTGIATRWSLDLGHFSERLATITAAEQKEYLEISTSASD